jgi:DNA-binding SARP family transcriptional activator
VHQPDLGLPRRKLIVRDELIGLLARRFEPGATAIVAGAGFGKTTLLRQAIATNAEAPAGVDRFITCTSALRVGSRFARALAEVVGLALPDPIDPPDAVDQALDLAGRTWPLGMALIVDDAHLLEGSDAERLLRHVVANRPPPVHVVIASRTKVRWLGSTRNGESVTEITEADLAFSAQELEALVEGSQVRSADVGALGGWPALTDLAVAFGVGGPADFVEDEVLSRFDPAQRRQLAAIAVAGGGDRGLLEAACGVSISPADVADQLPMTTVVDARLVVHPLWSRILAGELTAQEMDAVRSRVGEHLMVQEEPEAAASMFAEAADWVSFEAAIAATWKRGYIGSARDVVASWLELLPVDRRDGPTGTVLRGIAARVQDSFGERAMLLLEVAVERCRDAGATETEMVALGEYGYVCRARGDRERLLAVMARLGELAEGGLAQARPFVALAEAAIHDVVGDDVAVLAALARVPDGSLSDEWSSAVAFLRVTAVAGTGDRDALEAAARDCLRFAGPGAALARYTAALVAWRLGRPVEALALLPVPSADDRLTRVEQVVTATRSAFIESLSGKIAEATESIALARAAGVETAHPSFDGQMVVACAALAASKGDEATAAHELRSLLERHPLAEGGERLLRSCLGLAYVLLPEARDAFDDHGLGSALRVHLEVARAVVASRTGSTTPNGDLPPVDQVLVAVPLIWSVRLAAWAEVGGSPYGRTLAERIISVHGERGRDAIRGGVPDDPALDAGARDLLVAVSVPPSEQLRLDLLGPVTLQVGEVPCAHPNWDRDLVRALASLLALRGPMTRSAVAEALWPGSRPEVAARNLRTHLGFLRAALEPDRRAGEASFVLRSDDATVSLAGPPHLVVDVHRFLATLDAVDTSRVPRSEVDVALSLWHGRPLADLPDLEWVEAERASLIERFVTAALQDGAASLAGAMAQRAVVRSIDVLQVDPWSEPAYQLLVAAHIARGDRAAARRALQRCEAMLADLGSVPSPATEGLMRRLQRSDAVGEG